MNAETFEKEVLELRRRQRRFFNCRKDDPDRTKVIEIMREQESKVREEVEFVMMVRPKGKMAESDREQFFLDVADMVRKQKEWAINGGGKWYLNPAKEAEKRVDIWLQKFEEKRCEERQRMLYEAHKRQYSLFQ